MVMYSLKYCAISFHKFDEIYILNDSYIDGQYYFCFLALSHLYTKCEMFVNCDIFQHFHNEMIDIFGSRLNYGIFF
jgi:hypothetical protein